jgi:DNA-binding response OmpR family regulator
MLLWMSESDWDRETNSLPTNARTGTKHLTTGAALTVVLLDNDEEIRTVIALGLQRHHFCVLQAGTPDEVVQFRRNHPIQLLVADVGVLQPHAAKALGPIEELQPKINVLLISGYDRATLERRYEGLLAGREFLQKPFSPLLLATVLQQMAE